MGRLGNDRVTDPLRVGVVGLGRMGSYHAEALVDLDEVAIAAMADPRPGARGRAAQLHPQATLYADAAEMLDRARCEAVLVATPTPHHPGFVEASLDAGLHVLCEKPVALDPDESDRLGRLATSAGLVLQVGFWRRFASPWVAARDAVAAGRVGRPVLIRLSQWDADPPPPEFCDPAVSGGLAVDCGVHEFDLAEWLSGERLVGVRGEPMPIVEPRIGDVGDLDNLLVVGALHSGAKIVVDLSRNGRYGDDVRTEILGDSGAVFVDMLPHGRARIGTGDGVVDLPGSAAADAMRAGVRAQAAAFAARVRGAAVDVPDAFASSRAVRAALAAMRSLDSGAVEPV